MPFATIDPGRVLRGFAVVALLGAAFAWGLWTAAPDAASEAAEADAETWTCSMHPQIQLPEPGACPICGMDLIPLGDAPEGSSRRVTISERAKALARIRTTPVHRAQEGGELRLLGRLDYDETTVRTISPWTDGRIDRLFVRSEGAEIKRGQPVAALYSREAYAAQKELIGARRQLKRLKDALPVSRRAAADALDAAEGRLSLLGVSPKSIDRASRHVSVIAPYGGTVIEQLAREGAHVESGQAIFRIADLDRLWVQLDAYEGDLPRIQVGLPVELEVASLPDQTFEGRVDFIDPVVSTTTRTARVRVVVDNRKRGLRAGMFADAVIETDDGTEKTPPLVVPDSAPLFTGKRSLVYVEVAEASEPTYEAREVTLGPRIAHHYPVLSGLSEGERVVMQGAFVLDSELQIRGGRSMMFMPDDREREGTGIIEVDDAFRRGLAPIFEAYFALRDGLARDDLEGAKKHFAALVDAIESFAPAGPGEAKKMWSSMAKRMRGAALRGAAASDLDEARRVFEEVSAEMLGALRRFGNPMGEAVRVATCPMALSGRAASWVQRSDTIDNPYQGAKMLRCGSIDATVDPSAHWPASPEAPSGSGHQHHGGR